MSSMSKRTRPRPRREGAPGCGPGGSRSAQKRRRIADDRRRRRRSARDRRRRHHVHPEPAHRRRRRGARRRAAASTASRSATGRRRTRWSSTRTSSAPSAASSRPRRTRSSRRLAEDGNVQVEYRPINFLGLRRLLHGAANAFAVVLDERGPGGRQGLPRPLFEDQPAEDSGAPRTRRLVELAVEAGRRGGGRARRDRGRRVPGLGRGRDRGSVRGRRHRHADGAARRRAVPGATIEEIAANLKALA